MMMKTSMVIMITIMMMVMIMIMVTTMILKVMSMTLMCDGVTIMAIVII
jgi:hypothetical protein